MRALISPKCKKKVSLAVQGTTSISACRTRASGAESYLTSCRIFVAMAPSREQLNHMREGAEAGIAVAQRKLGECFHLAMACRRTTARPLAIPPRSGPGRRGCAGRVEDIPYRRENFGGLSTCPYRFRRRGDVGKPAPANIVYY
jgi:hypothetical protein